jgi:hypothetical protein
MTADLPCRFGRVLGVTCDRRAMVILSLLRGLSTAVRQVKSSSSSISHGSNTTPPTSSESSGGVRVVMNSPRSGSVLRPF